MGYSTAANASLQLSHALREIKLSWHGICCRHHRPARQRASWLASVKATQEAGADAGSRHMQHEGLHRNLMRASTDPRALLIRLGIHRLSDSRNQVLEGCQVHSLRWRAWHLDAAIDGGVGREEVGYADRTDISSMLFDRPTRQFQSTVSSPLTPDKSISKHRFLRSARDTGTRRILFIEALISWLPQWQLAPASITASIASPLTLSAEISPRIAGAVAKNLPSFTRHSRNRDNPSHPALSFPPFAPKSAFAGATRYS
jgi:hypothetical protein